MKVKKAKQWVWKRRNFRSSEVHKAIKVRGASCTSSTKGISQETLAASPVRLHAALSSSCMEWIKSWVCYCQGLGAGCCSKSFVLQVCEVLHIGKTAFSDTCIVCSHVCRLAAWPGLCLLSKCVLLLHQEGFSSLDQIFTAVTWKYR